MKRERYSSLKIDPAYWPHAQHFEATARGWGMTQTEIDQHLRFAAELPPGMSEAEIIERYNGFADERHISADLSSLAMGWHEQVAEQGIHKMPSIPVPAATDADRQRIGEIERDMRNPDSVYWGEAGGDLRDEYSQLLARVQGTPVEDVAPSWSTGRKAAIEKVMAADHDRYFRDQDMQAEYRSLLDGESPAPGARVPAGGRRGEIEKIMTTDFHTYDQNEALKGEYYQILARETASSSPASAGGEAD